MSAELFRSIAPLRVRLRQDRSRGASIGLVPTMGALHDGHLRLFQKARAHSRVVVASIFVNPLQFNAGEDFELYPRTFESDLKKCAEAGVEIVFAPCGEEMYPEEPATYVDNPEAGESLCGKFRPGHFRGVATVVMKLFQIVQPDFAYFGEKDAQQLAIVRRMVRDLNVPVNIVPVETVREADGLAMSSRNLRLGAEDRAIAPMLYRSLRMAADSGIAAAREFLGSQPRIRLEYLEIVDPVNMRPAHEDTRPALIAIAAWLGGVRLIDNLSL